VLGWVGTGATRSTLCSRPYLPPPRRSTGLPLQDAPELWRETSQVLESVSSARPRDVSDAPGRLHRRAKVLFTRDIGSWSTGWYLTLSEVRHTGRMVYFLHLPAASQPCTANAALSPPPSGL
jgi:hypothetical protein